MEVFLFFLFIFGIIAWAVSTGASRQQDRARRRNRHAAWPRSNTARPKPTPPPFDPVTATRAPQTRTLRGSAHVIDGDSLVIEKTQVRLFGVDAPELNHPFGQKAKWAMVRLCKGEKIRAEVTETDAYGRTVARCYLEDGRDLSAEMVKLGLAIDWARFSGGVYRSMEVPDARKKMWLADARQKGRMHVWAKFEARKAARAAKG